MWGEGPLLHPWHSLLSLCPLRWSLRKALHNIFVKVMGVTAAHVRGNPSNTQTEAAIWGQPYCIFSA